MTKVTKICEVCRNSYQVKPYRATSARFCSRSCKGKWIATFCFNDIDPSYRIGNTYRTGMRPANAFEKGHLPWNKYLKGIHLSPATEIKKGDYRCGIQAPIGTIEIRKRKRNNEIRAYVKIAQPNKWSLRSRVIWEGHNGPIPRGKIIHHKDHDTLNDEIENLSCLTRAEHLREHREWTR